MLFARSAYLDSLKSASAGLTYFSNIRTGELLLFPGTAERQSAKGYCDKFLEKLIARQKSSGKF